MPLAEELARQSLGIFFTAKYADSAEKNKNETAKTRRRQGGWAAMKKKADVAGVDAGSDSGITKFPSRRVPVAG